MVSHSLPSPPAEDSKLGLARKSPSSTKSIKPTNRVSKRGASSSSSIHHHEHMPHGAGADGRHKRVWKACERCRMKKTKCDGEFPCKRCKDDGMVCTAGVRKKVEYKQLPKGYAEVLENTQFALIATVHKLYSMVRKSQPWELGEPELNDRGQPVIHNIAQKLGCIRPNSDVDLPVHSVFPEDEAGMAELARQLDEQQQQQHHHHQHHHHHPPQHRQHLHPQHGGDDGTEAPFQDVVVGRDSDSSSDLDHSDCEHECYPSSPVFRRVAYGSADTTSTLSPQSFSGPGPGPGPDFDFSPTAPDLDSSALFGPSWVTLPKTQPNDLTMQLLQQAGMPNGLPAVDVLNQALVESDFGTIKPDILSCSNPDVMMGMGDPMICSGFDGEAMRL